MFPRNKFIILHNEANNEIFYVNTNNILYITDIKSGNDVFGEVNLRDNFVIVCDEKAAEI